MQSFKEKILSIERRKKLVERWVSMLAFFREKTLESLPRERAIEGLPREKAFEGLLIEKRHLRVLL